MIICFSFLKHLKDVTEWRLLPCSLVCPTPPSIHHWNVLIGAPSFKGVGLQLPFPFMRLFMYYHSLGVLQRSGEGQLWRWASKQAVL